MRINLLEVNCISCQVTSCRRELEEEVYYIQQSFIHFINTIH